jgi:hypothetical protein
MTLEELAGRVTHSPGSSVPDWMLGCFRRRCISFANGESDNQTIVYWFQSRTFTIDLRLPLAAEQVRAAALEDYSADELAVLANYEGWVAACDWTDEKMSWHGGTALQTTNRWPEPAELRRIGNCMTEFAPSGAYVEDWRLQPSESGPLIGLRLVEEYDPETEQRFPRTGGLIICGDHAAWVLGRSGPMTDTDSSLPDMAASAVGDRERLQTLFDFETSVASGSLAQGYTILHSTRPDRVGQPLLSEGSFDWIEDTRYVEQTFSHEGQNRVRVFEVDVIESDYAFALGTPSNKAAEAWFQQESTTLRRYTEVLL